MNEEDLKVLTLKVPHKVEYTNYRGETSIRTIIPMYIWYGHTEWHTDEQWLMKALDCDKDQTRDFAMKDMKPAWL